jgi:hypothetical protein
MKIYQAFVINGPFTEYFMRRQEMRMYGTKYAVSLIFSFNISVIVPEVISVAKALGPFLFHMTFTSFSGVSKCWIQYKSAVIYRI